MTRRLFIVFILCMCILFALPVLAADNTAPEPAPPASGVLSGPVKAQPPDRVPIGDDIADWQARWELARLLSYTKKYAASLAQYRELLKEKPGLLKARIEMATVLAWAGKSKEASAILTSIPQNKLGSEARLALADIYIAAKDYPAAESILSNHLRSNPSDHAARLKLAELLSWTKRYDASLKEYETLLEHRPDDVQIRRKYAYVLIWDGQRDKAAAQLRKSLGE